MGDCFLKESEMKIRFNGRVVILWCPVCGCAFSEVPQDCIRGLDGSYTAYCPECIERGLLTRSKVASYGTADIRGHLLIETPESAKVATGLLRGVKG